jgi:uncharacterized protein
MPDASRKIDAIRRGWRSRAPAEVGELKHNGGVGSVAPEPLAGLVGFARSLRHAGLAVDTQRTAAFVTALDELDLGNPQQVYWAGRLTLCSEPDDLVRYDAAFAAWFNGTLTIRETGPAQGPRRLSRIAPLTSTGSNSKTEPLGTTEPLPAAASDIERLRRRDLGELTRAEREHLRSVLALLRPEPPSRPSLRRRPARRGELDPRRTLRAAIRAYGEPASLHRRARSTAARRVVLLIDVSGSMNPYSDALLRFAHAVARRMPAEVFTIGTRLTRVSRQLRQRDPELALRAATTAVPDWSGGTRLGESIKAFLDRWGQRGVARRAVVVVCSDGWERGDAALLGEQFARLRRLAHKVFWLNPHAGMTGYEPIQSGIVAALPYTDRLLAGHSLAALEELLTEVRRA